jgi:hypothetical protein
LARCNEKKAAAELEAYKERIRLEREMAGERELARLGEMVKQKRRSKPKGA